MEENIFTLTVPQLKKKAKEYGIKGYSKMKLDELQSAIIGYQLRQDPRIQKMIIRR